MARKDLLTRLADAGEDAISKLGESPGMDRVLGMANSTRDRLDELTRRVRGMDELERRLERIEQRLDELTGTPSESEPASPPTAVAEPEPEPEAGPEPEPAAKTKASGRAKRSTAETGGDSPG